MRRNTLIVLGTLLVGVACTQADLIQEFNGFDTVWGTGVSGLTSSYFDDIVNGAPLSGADTGSRLPTFGPDRVTYPSGVGQRPSPGGAQGALYDQGVLGVRVDGASLTIQLASTLSPLTGIYNKSWKAWYGQGDLFVNVKDSGGLSHYALTTTWARDAQGNPIKYNKNHYADAQAFHLGGDPHGGSLEGHLVKLDQDAQVMIAGGKGAYNKKTAPDGLDLRMFARGGTDLGAAGHTHSTIEDLDLTWYLQRWTVDLASLSGDSTFDLALHGAVTCANDQIGGVFGVPEPSTAVLTLVGAFFLLHRRR